MSRFVPGRVAFGLTEQRVTCGRETRLTRRWRRHGYLAALLCTWRMELMEVERKKEGEKKEARSSRHSLWKDTLSPRKPLYWARLGFRPAPPPPPLGTFTANSGTPQPKCANWSKQM